MPFEFEDKDVKLFEKFQGLRNNVGPESFEPGDLVTALNIDITDENRIKRRKGYERTQTGSYHSIWSNGDTCLVMSAGSLNRYNPDGTLTLLHAGYALLPMSYDIIGSTVFFSNGVESGIYDNGTIRAWGIVPPVAQPTASLIGGSLPAGRYQYAMTFTRSDGSESGTGLATVVELTTIGGIGFSNLPVSQDNTVTGRNLYISPVNGDVMYRLMQFSIHETAAIYSFQQQGTLPLTTQHLTPPVPGHIVAVHYGIVYVAHGNTLSYSLPFAPELFDLRQNFKFSAPITLVAPLNTGIFIGTETEIVFLPGVRPDQFKVDNKGTYGVIPGTLAYANAADINPEALGICAMFASTEGICVGFENGNIRNITRGRFAYPITAKGSGLIRPHDGMIQYITTLQGAEVPANTAI